MIETRKNKQRRKRMRRFNGVLVFTLTFLLFLFIFGGALIWWLVQEYLPGQRDAEHTPSSAVSDVAPSFSAADAVNILLITTDNDAAQGFYVVRLDPANTRVRVLAIPSEIALEQSGDTVRGDRLFAQSGRQAVRDGLQKALGLSLPYTAQISFNEFEKMVDYFENGLVFLLDEDVRYQSEDGRYSYEMEGGKNLSLNARRIVSLMRYNGWREGRRQQTLIQAQLVSAMINQYMTDMRSLQTDFEQVIGYFETDIRIADFSRYQSGWEYLAARNKEGALCAATLLDGHYAGGEELLYFPKENIAQDLAVIYGATSGGTA